VFAPANISGPGGVQISCDFAGRPVSHEISPVKPDLANQRAAFEYVRIWPKNHPSARDIRSQGPQLQGFTTGGPCSENMPWNTVVGALEYSGLRPTIRPALEPALEPGAQYCTQAYYVRSESCSGLAVLVGSQESSGLAGIQWPRRNPVASQESSGLAGIQWPRNLAITIAQVVKAVEEVPRCPIETRRHFFAPQTLGK
jgi:hypothetical protein